MIVWIALRALNEMLRRVRTALLALLGGAAGFPFHCSDCHDGVVSLAQFHPRPNRLLLFTASDDCTIRVWDLVTSKIRALLRSHMSVVTSLAFPPGGWTMVSAGARAATLVGLGVPLQRVRERRRRGQPQSGVV